MLTVGSLFSGIGGFDLGLERTGGFRTAWFCEQDPYCQAVLAKHWPGVPCHPDITELHHPAYVDVLCGGFPCQDLSYAGLGAGLSGARSGLWTEYARLIGEVGPRYVIVENVSALLARGLGVVLGDLATLGYDAEWDCIPASAVGAPHQRDRVWLVAYPVRPRLEGHRGASGDAAQEPHAGRQGAALALAHPEGQPVGTGLRTDEPRGVGRGRSGDVRGPSRSWATEPDVGRVAHGVPARVDRLRALGNALVPQVAEWIGQRVIEWEREGVSHAA